MAKAIAQQKSLLGWSMATGAAIAALSIMVAAPSENVLNSIASDPSTSFLALGVLVLAGLAMALRGIFVRKILVPEWSQIALRATIFALVLNVAIGLCSSSAINLALVAQTFRRH